MMILGYDSETTNLPLWKDPSDDPRQPHLIQLAMILQDMEGNEVDRFASIVKPGSGAVMGKEAFDAHGISLERAMDEGCDPLVAMDAFLAFANRSTLFVGHNESFDRRIIRIHSARHRGIKWEPEQPSFCTLNRSKYIINLPATEKMMAAGIPSPKSPNLGECIRHFFDEDLDGAHDALVDVTACLRVFWHLIRECGLPMFREKRASGSSGYSRPAHTRPNPSANPFAAAASVIGGAK